MIGKVIITTIILSACFAQPAIPDERIIDSASRTEIHGQLKKKKEIYSIRHPKIYQSWRKARKTCIKITPVVEFASAVATPIMIVARCL